MRISYLFQIRVRVKAHLSLHCSNTLHIIIAEGTTVPQNAVGSEADCRYRAREFDPGQVPYFHGDYS